MGQEIERYIFGMRLCMALVRHFPCKFHVSGSTPANQSQGRPRLRILPSPTASNTCGPFLNREPRADLNHRPLHKRQLRSTQPHFLINGQPLSLASHKVFVVLHIITFRLSRSLRRRHSCFDYRSLQPRRCRIRASVQTICFVLR